MPFVPDWAPNSHPLFVHFPIALLFAAVLIDLLALAWRSRPWLQPAAVTLYVLGVLGAVAAYLSGQDAADSVMLPAAAQPVLTEHADLAWWTMWFFLIYAAARLAMLRWEGSRRLVVHGVLFLVGLGGLYLPWAAADHGAEMVFRHGVGVQIAQEEETRRDTSAAAAEGPALISSLLLKTQRRPPENRPPKRISTLAAALLIGARHGESGACPWSPAFLPE